MKLLLDTHIILWFLTGDSRISNDMIEIIADKNQIKFISMATLWEVAIKLSTGKLILSEPIGDYIDGENIKLLPIKLAHVHQIQSLPFHHRDPFDRMLIAQSMVENLVLVSEDTQFKNYDINLF
jgi:PIN domain nuclease of toxin-antitoxin system